MLNQIEKRGTRKVVYKPIKTSKKTANVLDAPYVKATIKAFDSIVNAPDIDLVEEEKPIKKQPKKKNQEETIEETIILEEKK
jgi:hypothetical protein